MFGSDNFSVMENSGLRNSRLVTLKENLLLNSVRDLLTNQVVINFLVITEEDCENFISKLLKLSDKKNERKDVFNHYFAVMGTVIKVDSKGTGVQQKEEQGVVHFLHH